jgi:hypothetical protein
MVSLRTRLAVLLWLSPSAAHGSRDLASGEVKTGFQVVFEYVTVTDCGTRACGAQEPFKAPDVTTYTTVLPEVCETGWKDVTYTITETLLTSGAKPTGGRPPPGFIAT